MRQANVDYMKASGKVVLLEADADTIYSRITTDPKTGAQRPDLTDKDQYGEIVHLLECRRPFYHAAAHVVLDSSEVPPEELIDRIIAEIRPAEK